MGAVGPPLALGPQLHEISKPLRTAAEHAGDGFFPLAALSPGCGPSGGAVSRGTAQRIAKRHALERHTFETIDAVNALAGYQTPTVDSI